MNLVDLQQQIINNNLKDMYIFIGEEIAVQSIYIKKIAQVKQLEIMYVDSYKQIMRNLAGDSLFGDKKLYVIINDIDIMKHETVWPNINANGNLIIFKYSSIDKRSKFANFFADFFVDFVLLSDEILSSYIQKDMNLSKEHCNELIKICGNNYNRILLELDKIKNYDIHNQQNYDAYFVALNMQGAFYKDVSDITFTFVDYVVTRQVDKVALLRKELKQMDESTLKVIGLLYNNFKIILLIQCCKSNDVCKTTGLTSHQVYFNTPKINCYSTGELVNVLKLLQKVESGIKTGRIDEDIALDYLLVNIL